MNQICYLKTTYTEVANVCRVPLNYKSNTASNQLDNVANHIPNCLICEFTDIRICKGCVANYYLFEAKNLQKSCLHYTTPIPPGYGYIVSSFVPNQPGDKMSVLNTKIRWCSDNNCLSCTDNYLKCVSCDLSKDYFLTDSKCEFRVVVPTFYTISQNLDFMSDNQMKFNVEFYELKNNQTSASHILASKNIDISTFGCRIKISEDEYSQVKSCETVVEDQIRPTLLLTLDTERLKNYQQNNSSFKFQTGNYLNITLSAVENSSPNLRILSDQVLPKFFKDFVEGKDHKIILQQNVISGLVTGDFSKQIDTMTKVSSAVGVFLSIGVYVAEASTIVFAFWDLDSTGLLIRLSQFFSFLEKIKYFNFKFGKRLGLFFEKLSIIKVGLPYEKRIKDDFWPQKKKYTGKLANYSPVFFYRDLYFSVKISLFYLIYFTLVIMNGYYTNLKRRMNIIESTIIRLNIIKKFYFFLLNIVVIDTFFYGISSLLHLTWTSPDPVMLLTFINMMIVTSEYVSMIYQVKKSDETNLSIWVLKHYNLFREFKNGKPVLDLAKLRQSKVIPKDLNDSVITGLEPSKIVRSVYKNEEIKDYAENMEKIGRVFNIRNQAYDKDSDGCERVKVISVSRTLKNAGQNQQLLKFCFSELDFSYDKTAGMKIIGRDYEFVKQENILYTLRLPLYIILILSLQFLPSLAIFLTLLIESYMMITTWRIYCKHDHLRSYYLAAHRVIQSLFLIAIYGSLAYIQLRAKTFDQQVPLIPQLIIIIAFTLLIGFEYFMVLLSFYQLFNHQRMRLAMNAELCQKIKNKLDPIQYTYMDVDEMLDFVEFNQGKRDNYAILGQLEIIENLIMTNPQIVYSKKYLESRAKDTKKGPVAIQPQQITIKKVYPFLEKESKNSSSYKFNPRQSSSANRHLVFQNFQILTCHKGEKVYVAVESESQKQQKFKHIKLEKQGLLNYAPEKTQTHMDFEDQRDRQNTMNNKNSEFASNLSRILISDFESPSDKEFAQQSERMNKRDQVYKEDIWVNDQLQFPKISGRNGGAKSNPGWQQSEGKSIKMKKQTYQRTLKATMPQF